MCTISIFGLNTLTYELTVNENSDDGTMWCPIDVVTPIAGAPNSVVDVKKFSVMSVCVVVEDPGRLPLVFLFGRYLGLMY